MSKKTNEHFSGYFNFLEVGKRTFFPNWGETYPAIFITKVIYSKNTVIVFWNDGTKTISKCSEKDEYDYRVGLLNCVVKKFGGYNASKIIDDWGPFFINGKQYDCTVDVSDVRRRNK